MGKHSRTQDQEFPNGQITGKLRRIFGESSDAYKPGRDAKPPLDPKVVERFNAQGEGITPPGSRHVDPDMM